MGLTVREHDVPREMLYIADEVFFCGTAAEVTPIRSIDKIQIGAGRRGPVTTSLQTAFFDYINGSSLTRIMADTVNIPSRCPCRRRHR
jgi:branched-chain amino acid aminotransferase